MQQYICKCSKQIKKSTDAQTTGNRLEGFERGHECWGCPFVVEIKDGWPPKVTGYECRMSKDICYGSYTDIRPDIKSFCVGHVYTLDFDFARDVASFFNRLDGRDGNLQEHFTIDRLRGADFSDDGMYRLTLLFQKNKKGLTAKDELFRRFFDDGSYRADLPESEEKKLVLAQIKQEIAAAKEWDELPVSPQGTAPEPAEPPLAELEPMVPAVVADASADALEPMESVGTGSFPLFVGMPVHAPLMSTNPLVIDYIGRSRYGKSVERIIALDAVTGGTHVICDANLRAGALLFSRAEAEAAREKLSAARGIPEITAEIRLCKQQTVQSIIRIGQCLVEAKELLQHGQWLEWLEGEVQFSERTAQRFMQLAEQFSNPSPVTDLNYTKLLALLAIPEGERDAFLAETHEVNGADKTVAEMSKRELAQVIKERDAANKRAARAEERIADACAEVAKAKGEAERAKSALQNSTPEQLEAARREERERVFAEFEAQRRADAEAHRAAENELHRQLEEARAASEPLPRWLTEQAAETFLAGLDSAMGQYTMVASCMAPADAARRTEDCITALEGARGTLYTLLNKARAASDIDELELPSLD